MTELILKDPEKEPVTEEWTLITTDFPRLRHIPCNSVAFRNREKWECILCAAKAPQHLNRAIKQVRRLKENFKL